MAIDIPAVSVFDAATATPDEMVQALKAAGGCIVRNLVPKETCAQIEKEVRPHLAPVPPKDATPPLKPAGERGSDAATGATDVFDDIFFPKQSRRKFAQLDVCPSMADSMVLNPLWNAVSAAFLTSYISHYQGQDLIHSVAQPQLNNTICFSIMPGSTDQPLHKDDPPQHCHHEAIARYPDDLTKTHRDSCIGLFVAGKPATKQNGATRFIPGSHLWGDEQPPDESLTFYAELDVGDAFMMLGSCYHGGSANHTEDEERLIFSLFEVRGWMRPEENMYCAIDPAKAAKWPYALQRKIGYYIADPATGYIEQEDPIKWLVAKHGAAPPPKTW